MEPHSLTISPPLAAREQDHADSARAEQHDATFRAVQFRDAVQRRTLAVADGLAAAFALTVSVSLVGDDGLKPASLGIVALVIVVAKVSGLYDRDEALINKTTVDEIPALLQLATGASFATWLGDSALVEGHLSQLQVVVLWVVMIGAVAGGRGLARALASRLIGPERCLVVGDTATYRRLRSQLSDERKALLVAHADSTRGEPIDYVELRELVEERRVHRVIVVPDHHPESIIDLVRAAKGIGVRVTVVPRVLEVVGSTVQFDSVGGLPLLGVRSFGLTRSSKYIKRALDVVLTVAGVIAIAPALAVIALAIRLDSPGPILFRQQRVGRDGRRFCIYKFRTMVRDAEQLKADLGDRNEADGLFKIADDPRITRVGRFLRRTSLDELPQLINVLKGEMSLVGPRPLILAEDERITGYDRRRLNLTPGMTGPWQVLGSSRVPLTEMVKIDYLYVAGWTLWADVKILLRTLPHMLRRQGQ